MELLGKANAIRLRSHQGAYVVANDDRETVGESVDGLSPNAKWVVERVGGNPNVIRLKSRFGLYLSPSDGKLDWEPIPNGVKFKSGDDRLLLANAEPKSQNWAVSLMRWVGELLEGCCEPNSVSHHDPDSQNWVFWHVVVEDEPVANNTLSNALLDATGLEPNYQVANNMLHFGSPLLELNQVSHPFGQINAPVALDPKKPRPPQESNPFGQTNAPPPSPPSPPPSP